MTADSLEDLAQQIELSRAVLLVLNAGFLWNALHAADHGEANHAVLVTAPHTPFDALIEQPWIGFKIRRYVDYIHIGALLIL